MPVPGLNRETILAMFGKKQGVPGNNPAGSRAGAPPLGDAMMGAPAPTSDVVDPANDYETNLAILSANSTDGNIGAFQALYGPGAGRPGIPDGHVSMANTYGDYNSMTGATDRGRNQPMPGGQNFQPSPSEDLNLQTNRRIMATNTTDGNIGAYESIYGTPGNEPDPYGGAQYGVSPGFQANTMVEFGNMDQKFQALAQKFGPEQAQAIIDELLNAEVLDQTAPHGNRAQMGTRSKRLSDIR